MLSVITCTVLLSSCAGMGSFEDFDSNHDGGVSRDEAGSKQALADIFNSADDNSDGRLDEDEFALARTAIERGRGDQKRRKTITETGGPER